MKKALFIISYILTIFFTLTAQKRENKESDIPDYRTIFESQPLKGDSVSFWSYNNQLKKWGRRIATEYTPHDENQNFTSLKSLVVIGGNEKYYVIVYNNINVHHLSLSAMCTLGSTSQYLTTDSYYYIILGEKEINLINKNIETKIGSPLKITSKLSSQTVMQKSYWDISKQVKNLIHEKGYKSTKSFWIEFELIDNKGVVRFRLPENSSCGKNYFEKNYFEISLAEFLKLIPKDYNIPINTQ